MLSRTILKALLGILLIMRFAVAVSLAAPMTLQNPGFETSWTGRSMVSGWEISSISPNFTTTYSTTTKYADLASLALGRTTSTLYHIYQEVAGSAGKQYTYSAKVYDNGNGKVRLYVKFYNDTTELSSDRYSTYSINSDSWQTLSVTFTSPANTNKMRIEVRSYNDPTFYPGTQYIDEVVLDKLSTTDTIPPTISLTTPMANAKVGGIMAVSASASDNVGVTSVKFYKNQDLIATDTASPFSASFDWNVDTPDTNYTITAIAADANGNTNASTITVNKPGNTFAGPGSTITSGGVFFQVWAPHAQSVSVKGDFNTWSQNANIFNVTADGWWYGFVPGAAAEQKYKYQILGPSWNNVSFDKPDPYSRMMEHSAGASIIKNTSYAWTDGAWTTPYFEDLIIYELHVGTFIGKNDGQNYPGNFSKLLSKLDYIKGLGANAVELLPVNEVPGDYYLGYSSVSFFAIESSYGTGTGKAYDELKAVINVCHAKGLAVIIDIVPNHISTYKGQDNFLWNYDGDSEYNDGGIYFNGQHTEWGIAPDWGRNEVKRYIEDACRYFIDELHVDGLRWDATSRIRDKPNGWESMRNIVWNLRQSYPRKIFIAEELPYNKATVESGNFHTGWYVEFHHSLEKALGGDQLKGSTPEAAINGGDYSAVYKRIVYSIGHDEARNGCTYNADTFGGRDSWDSRSKNRLMGALQFFVPGIPMIFQGEEFLQNGWFNDQYENAVNWRFQTDGVGSQMQTMYKAATAVRWENDAFRRGSFAWAHKRDINNVLAFRRNWGANVALVVVNLSDVDYVNNHSYGISTGGQVGQWTQIFNSQDAAYGGWNGSGNAYYEPWTQEDGKIYLNVPKYSVMVMRLK